MCHVLETQLWRARSEEAVHERPDRPRGFKVAEGLGEHDPRPRCPCRPLGATAASPGGALVAAVPALNLKKTVGLKERQHQGPAEARPLHLNGKPRGLASQSGGSSAGTSRRHGQPCGHTMACEAAALKSCCAEAVRGKYPVCFPPPIRRRPPQTLRPMSTSPRRMSTSP